MLKRIVNEVFSLDEYKTLRTDFQDIFTDILFFQVSAHLFSYSIDIATMENNKTSVNSLPFILNILFYDNKEKDYHYLNELKKTNKILNKIIADENESLYYFSSMDTSRNVLLNISKMDIKNPTLLVECYNTCLKRVLLNVYEYLRDDNNFKDFSTNQTLKDILSTTGTYTTLFSTVLTEEKGNNSDENYISKSQIRVFDYTNKKQDVKFYRDLIILFSLRFYQSISAGIDENRIKMFVDKINEFKNFMILKGIVSSTNYLKYYESFNNPFVSSFLGLFLQVEEDTLNTKIRDYQDTLLFSYNMKEKKKVYKKVVFPVNIRYSMVLKPVAKEIIEYMNKKEENNSNLLILEEDCPDTIKDFFLDYRTSSDDFWYALENGYIDYQQLTDTSLDDLTSEDLKLLEWYSNLIPF